MTASNLHSGIDLRHRDPGTRVQDDLFEHVNGKWIAEHEIPADRAVDGAFRTLYDQAEVDVRAIIEDCAAAAAEPGTDAQRIGDLFSSFMDEAAIEAAGIAPIAAELEAIAGATDRDSLAVLLGTLARVGVGGPIGHYVDTDAKNSTRYLAYFTQSGIGLPDESYYREDSYAPIRQAYVAHIAAMFQLAGVEHDAQTVFELERKLAGHHWDVVKRRDAELSYNLVSFDELVAGNAGFNWTGWLTAVAGGTQGFAEIVVRQPSFLTGFAALWNSEPLSHWQAWATWRLLHSRAAYLSTPFVEENFAFYGKTLTGTEQVRERWKRGVSVVQELLGESVGKLYVAKHFPPESKARMLELVANLTEAYRRNIAELPWMSEPTRQAALVKLEKSAKSRGARPNARCTPSVKCALRPSRMVPNR